MIKVSFAIFFHLFFVTNSSSAKTNSVNQNCGKYLLTGRVPTDESKNGLVLFYGTSNQIFVPIKGLRQNSAKDSVDYSAVVQISKSFEFFPQEGILVAWKGVNTKRQNAIDGFSLIEKTPCE